MPITSQDFPFYRAVAAFEQKQWAQAVGDFIAVAEQSNLAALHYLNYYLETPDVLSVCTPEQKTKVQDLCQLIPLLQALSIATDLWFNTSILKMQWTGKDRNAIKRMKAAAKTCSNARVFLEHWGKTETCTQDLGDFLRNLAKEPPLYDLYMALNYTPDYYTGDGCKITKLTYEVVKKQIEQEKDLVPVSGAIEEKLGSKKPEWFTNIPLLGNPKIQAMMIRPEHSVDENTTWMSVAFRHLSENEKWMLYPFYRSLKFFKQVECQQFVFPYLLPKTADEVTAEMSKKNPHILEACNFYGILNGEEYVGDENPWCKKAGELGLYQGWLAGLQRLSVHTPQELQKRRDYFMKAYALNPEETLRFLVNSGNLLGVESYPPEIIEEHALADLYFRGLPIFGIAPDLRKSISYYEKIVNKHSVFANNYALRNHIGYLYHKLYDVYGDKKYLECATEWFMSALKEKEKNSWQALFNMSRVLFVLDRYSPALISCLLHARNLLWKQSKIRDKDIENDLGLCFHLSRQYDKAAFYYDSSIKMNFSRARANKVGLLLSQDLAENRLQYSTLGQCHELVYEYDSNTISVAKICLHFMMNRNMNMAERYAYFSEWKKLVQYNRSMTPFIEQENETWLKLKFVFHYFKEHWFEVSLLDTICLMMDRVSSEEQLQELKNDFFEDAELSIDPACFEKNDKPARVVASVVDDKTDLEQELMAYQQALEQRIAADRAQKEADRKKIKNISPKSPEAAAAASEQRSRQQERVLEQMQLSVGGQIAFKGFSKLMQSAQNSGLVTVETRDGPGSSSHIKIYEPGQSAPLMSFSHHELHGRDDRDKGRESELSNRVLQVLKVLDKESNQGLQP